MSEPSSIPCQLRERADNYWTHRAAKQADLDRAAAAEIERLRYLAHHYLDTLRLLREGKPVPVEWLEQHVRETLGERGAQP